MQVKQTTIVAVVAQDDEVSLNSRSNPLSELAAKIDKMITYVYTQELLKIK